MSGNNRIILSAITPQKAKGKALESLLNKGLNSPTPPVLPKKKKK